jgi:hypothetical protein
MTIPNQLGVAYNAHVIEAILTHVAPALGVALTKRLGISDLKGV